MSKLLVVMRCQRDGWARGNVMHSALYGSTSAIVSDMVDRRLRAQTLIICTLVASERLEMTGPKTAVGKMLITSMPCCSPISMAALSPATCSLVACSPQRVLQDCVPKNPDMICTPNEEKRR